ncbi:hypothetical protein BJY04DRAFT_198425 [Aspergillus karnatakaensis]|uniref:uncharacterized protein n=1 Tax=Aspergillus karnatakaensis TaxID=1810916 RepID=UPI003CCC94B2
MSQLTSLSLISILYLLLSTTLASYSPQLEILYWPVAEPEPSVLARVSYDPVTLKSDLIDYDIPADVSQDLTREDLARVGFYVATPSNPKQWVGTLTSLSALRGDETQRPTLRLYISAANEPYHVSLSSDTARGSSLKNLQLEVVADKAGPSPHLNRPIVVGPDGKNPEDEAEKTLFQKYWWVLLIVTFIAMSGGGEQQ